MRTQTNFITTRRYGTLRALVTVAAFALFQLPASAGGPGWLRLPVDGLTADNHAACVKLISERLRASVMASSSPGFQVHIRDGCVRMPLGSKPVSLGELEAALEGSPFRIPSDELIFDRVVRFKIDTADSIEDLSADLRVTPDIHVSTKKLKRGGIAVLVQDARRRSKPLLAYRDLQRIVAAHGAELIDVTWGADPEVFGDGDYMHWVCGAPYGAVRMIEVKAPAADSISKTKARPATGKSGTRTECKAG